MSSQHRPGAKVSLSPAGYSKEQLKKVENLEAQLEQLPSKKSDDQASRLRMRLCEVVSDIILTDPLFALQHDCIGRLWRSCFYGPIGTLRSRISREKRKKGPNVAKLEKSLKHFLGEAITLYEYLITQYHGKLVPSQHDPTMTPNSQDSSSQNSFLATDSQAASPSRNPAGVVPGLFRMNIHMGDLYRYESNYHKASTHYNNAAKLSPGRGNPYNQLAVVAQLKDTAAPLNAVALYWYARSLLTTHEPFEISKANLNRLFQSNRDWFHKQPTPTVVDSGAREMVKSQRTVASRHFLSQFVDLHFSFFQGIQGTASINNEQQQPNNNTEALKDDDVVKQMQALLTPCGVLLGASAFGDALLCKMVVICAFSEAYHPQGLSEQTIQETEILSRIFTLAFGACLAERAAVGLAKIQDQPEKMGNPGKAPPSVRLLLPLLLVCEYMESRPINVHDTASFSPETREFCDTTVESFWQKMIEVMNILTNLRGPLGLDSVVGGETWENSCLSEFSSCVGYSPFEGFLHDPRASSREDGFASVEEAADVLELTQQESQESQGTQQESSTVEEYKVKVARVLAFGDRMAASNDTTSMVGRRLERTLEGTYVWNDEPAAVDEHMTEVDQNENPMEEENNTQPPVDGKKKDDGGDVLVYSVPEGGGPALLVPGMVLQNRALANVPVENKEQKSDGFVGGPPMSFTAPPPGGLAPPTFPVAMAVDKPAPVPTAPVLPPPGFGVAAMPPTAAMPLQGVPTGAPPVMGTNIPGFSPVMQQGLVAGLPPTFGQGFNPMIQQQQQQHHSFEPTIGTSMNMFGGPEALKTGNPFAAASTPAVDANGNLMLGLNVVGGGANSINATSFLTTGLSNGGASAEPTLLGSGLLTSLFEDAGDKTTKNPFAT
ncbi:Protein SMG7 [Seminavis robusta]|uniref:Protein SMG7 n=1 Tax=Seminavis robusta TaxID=568900 RepID=A0A9N8E9G0_9STRA|nr:Protein SMG7 [Seminavis robusta]|eukprot:Sro819_g207120.1 Protein SMG7 (890) ;mRNA; r:27172-29841